MSDTAKPKKSILPRSELIWCGMFLWMVLAVFVFVLLDRFGVLLGNTYYMALLAQFAVFLPPAVYWLAVYKTKSAEALWLTRPHKSHWLLILSSVVMLIAFGQLYAFFAGSLSGSSSPFLLYRLYGPRNGSDPWKIIPSLLVFAVLPALLEELFFRGVLPHAFRRSGPVVTAILSSLLFALFQFHPAFFPLYFLLGLWLYLILYTTKSLTASVLAHLLYRMFAQTGQSALTDYYLSAGSGTLFLFLLWALFLLSFILASTAVIRVYRAYAKMPENLHYNEEALQSGHPVLVLMKAHLKLLLRALANPCLWLSVAAWVAVLLFS